MSETKEVTGPMPELRIAFTVYGKPEPQGSSKAFIVGGRARITSDNKKLKPYRQELADSARFEIEKAGFEAPFASKHVAVLATYRFYFERPPSIPKSRIHHVVKPDLDKLIRATGDALKGILYTDDSQVVGHPNTHKFYGSPARVEIEVSIVRVGQEHLFGGAS